MSRGSCPTDSGDPDEVENNNPDATTHFSKIRVGAPYCTVLYCTCLLYCALQIGCLGCTYPGGAAPTTTRKPTTPGPAPTTTTTVTTTTSPPQHHHMC